MKLDKHGIGYRVLVPVLILVIVIALALLFLIRTITDRIEEDYFRFNAITSANQVSLVLELAAAELTSAKLTSNPVVIEAKKRAVLASIKRAWSKSSQNGIISTAQGALLLSTLPPRETSVILRSLADGYSLAEGAAGDYHCYTSHFPLWGWTVTTVLPENTSHLGRTKVLLLVPLVALGTLLIIGGIFLVLQRNLQRPVATMVSAVGSEIAVPETGVAEFDRIGQAVNDALEKVRDRTARLATELEERRRAENEVREKEEHIRLLLSSTAEGIYGIDLQGTCTFCNRAALRMLGYELEKDLLGKNMRELVNSRRSDGSDYPAQECRIYQAYRENRGVHAADEVFWRADGASIPVEYWSYPVAEKGVVTGAVVTFIDISERLRSEMFIRNILETVDEGFLLIDREFTILSANRAYSRQAGIPLEEIVGRKCHEISHHLALPCDDSGEACSARMTAETGRPCAGTHIHRDSSDNERKIEIKTYPVPDAAGRVTSIILTSVDITEKSRLEQQLHQAQKMEAIGQLAGGIAHDFNNVLSAIVGYGSLLKKQVEAGGQARFFVEQIMAAAERAASLTRQILAFSRKQVVQLRPTNINEIVRGMEKFIERLLGEEIEIRTALTNEDATAMVDAGQMEQVLMNLATNARDAMPEGGVLLVGTDVVDIDEENASRCGLDGPGGYVLLSVSDTGTGMDEQTRLRIFDPFFTTKAMGRGTGLGLAIVYGIIKQHQGNIMVSSEPGKGTTFRIYLPLTGSRAATRQAATETAVRGGTETILLAEDDPDVRGYMKLVLEDHGYTVLTAVDGNDAVSRFRERQGDIGLCLFDVIMPKKNGKMAFREIRSLRRDAKAVFMSGYAADIIKEKDLLDENTVLLNKPVLPHELLAKVREVLDS